MIVLSTLLVATGEAGEGAAESRPPPGFVRLSEVAPTIVQDVRYATSDNFVGTPIEGYEVPEIWVTSAAGEALRHVQRDLAAVGLGLKVFDGYRPQRAVAHFVRWAQDLSDRKTKHVHYPDVPKRELFARGYIALESGHSRGSSVDVTLVRRKHPGHGEALDMGTPFDFFGRESWPSSEAVSATQKTNRERLRAAMIKGGFQPYEQEWWHFTLENEPFPETYFDFPIR